MKKNIIPVVLLVFVVVVTFLLVRYFEKFVPTTSGSDYLDSIDVNNNVDIDNIRVGNVFREIYFSEVALLVDGYPTNPSLSNISKISDTPFGLQGNREVFEGVMVEEYVDGAMGNEKSFTIWVDTNEETLTLVYTYILEETDSGKVELVFKYVYEIDTWIMNLYVEVFDDISASDNFLVTNVEMCPYLEKYDLDWEDLRKISNKALYDLFLNDWFESNKGYTKFSKDDLGTITLFEDTYLRLLLCSTE